MLLNGAAYVWDDEMKVPYLVHNDQWVGFDDERSIRNKMHWLKDKGYGGEFFPLMRCDVCAHCKIFIREY